MGKDDEDYHRTFGAGRVHEEQVDAMHRKANTLPLHVGRPVQQRLDEIRAKVKSYQAYQYLGGGMIHIHCRPDQNFWQYATEWERTFSTLCASSSSRQAVPVVDDRLTVIGHHGVFPGSNIFVRKDAAYDVARLLDPGEPLLVRALAPPHCRALDSGDKSYYNVFVTLDGAVRGISGEGYRSDAIEPSISPFDVINLARFALTVSRVMFISARNCSLKSIEFKGRQRVTDQDRTPPLAGGGDAGRTTSRGMGAMGPGSRGGGRTTGGEVPASGGIRPRYGVDGRPELTVDEMGNYLAPMLRSDPELVRLVRARRLGGDALTREVRGSLDDWARRTGKQWEVVPQEHVQRLTGERGNFASMQGNRLLIERQVLDNPQQFHREAVHELVSAVLGGRGTPKIYIAGLERQADWHAQKIFEIWIRETGSFDPIRQLLAPR